MKNLIVMLLMSLAYCQFITKGNKCLCNELLTESDCIPFDSCIWNAVYMRCNTSNVYHQTTVITTHVSVYPQTQSYSYYCNQFSLANCQREYSCAWSNQKCSYFVGCTPYLLTTNESCKQISNRCITDGIKCVELDACYTYKYERACNINKEGKYCFWNPSSLSCENVDTCSKLPKKLKTDAECRTQFSYCTTQIDGGCVESGFTCSDQVAEIACYTNKIQDLQCIWIDGKCKDKYCENASTLLTTDKQCKDFSPSCTTKINGGCIIRSICADNQNEEACVTDNDGNECLWTGVMCVDKTCQNAPAVYDTNLLCHTVNPNCITNGSGCVMNYACSSAVREELCKMDMENNECIWIETSCQKKKCSMALPGTICKEYMSTCIDDHDSNGCIEKICENAPISMQSNDECEFYLPAKNCITKNGGGCRSNSTCNDIDISAACVKNKLGNLCFWDSLHNKCLTLSTCGSINVNEACIKDAKGQMCEWVISNLGQGGQCVDKFCSSAPSSLLTEYQCSQYFKTAIESSCTTKKGGGCQLKNECSDAEVKEACTTNKNGDQCFWDLTTLNCRMLQCQDIKEQTFSGCNKQLKNCTIGLDQYCDDMQPCGQIKNKQQCWLGSDGVCLWIDNYLNVDQTQGACFQFDGCQSIKWKTDSECKMISLNCTTNGQQCIPITDCQNTNLTGGCKTGSDGECIQSVPSLFSTKSAICSKFINCGEAYYLTHEECQQAHGFCTTNGETGCRDLNSCQYYQVRESCHFNNIGIVKDESGRITSTGKCVWDEKYQLCRDQQCSDLNFNTQNQCESIMSNCTSDGTSCIQKDFCATYQESELQCNFKVGLEGPCQWDENKCKQKTCQQIVNGTTLAICQEVKNCVSDGTKCIPKSNCSTYTSQSACSSEAIDGICIWTESSQLCSLMKSCDQASLDNNACQRAKDRCVWKFENSQSKCFEHTCSTFQKQTGECQYFDTFDESQYQICKVQSGVCTPIDASTLTEQDCYRYSLYLYSWNPISNKCSQCSKIITNGTNQTQKNNQTSLTQLENILNLLAGLFAFAAF